MAPCYKPSVMFDGLWKVIYAIIIEVAVVQFPQVKLINNIQIYT